jgi:ABC-type transporter Mla MlaB component
MKKRKQATGVRHSRTKAHARVKPRMRRTRANTSPAGVFALSADCTVAASAALKSGLLEVLREPTSVTLDIASVQRIDTAGIQLITAFVREREALGLQVEWRGAAPAFTSAARLLGVASVLRLPEQPS